MSKDPVALTAKIKGYLAQLLMLIPILHAIPVSSIQGPLDSINTWVIALLGLGGAAMAATSPAIAGKHSPETKP